MGIASAEVTHAVPGSWNASRRQYMVTYCVTMEEGDEDVASTKVLAEFQQFQFTSIGLDTMVYEGDAGVLGFDDGAIVTGIRAPKRDANDRHPLKWIVEVEYTWDYTWDLSVQPVEITPYYKRREEPWGPVLFSGHARVDEDGDLVDIDIDCPPGHPFSGYPTLQPQNSAGEDFSPPPLKETIYPGWRVSWTAKNCLIPYENYIGKYNIFPFRLFAWDCVQGPLANDNRPFGQLQDIIFDRTFGQTELFVADHNASVFQIHGKNFYRHTLDIEFDKLKGYRYFLDQGLNQRVEAGDDNDKGGTWKTDEVPNSGTAPIPTAGGKDATKPQLLDGCGKPLKTTGTSAQAPVYLRYDVAFGNSTDFDFLGIGVADQRDVNP